MPLAGVPFETATSPDATSDLLTLNRSVRRYASNYGLTSHDCEDARQDAHFHYFLHGPGPAVFNRNAYLWTMGRNAVLDTARKNGRLPLLLEPATLPEHPSPDFTSHLDLHDLLARACSRLTAREQAFVALLLDHGMTGGEATRALGITNSAFTFRVYRKLRSILGAMGFHQNPAA